MDFYKQFLAEREEGAPALLNLAIFGKHPGWDDHIPDLGRTTESILLLKRVLYVRGIGGLIDSGSWEQLGKDERIDAFAHAFFAQRGGEAMVGRIWGSKDGKGRERYPMIAVVHIQGFPLQSALGKVLALLGDLQEDCLAVSTAADVIARLEQSQAELDAMARSAVISETFLPARAPLQRMLGRPPLSQSGPHARLLYEIRNRFEVFSAAALSKSLPEKGQGGEHIRLPMEGFRDGAEAFLAWTSYLRTQISARVPLLLVAPDAGGWVDAVVGLFNPPQLRCLRTKPNHHPCVTDIDFNIPPEFAARVEAIRGRLGDGRNLPNENSVFGARGEAPSPGPDIGKAREGRGLLFAAVLGAVVLVALLFVWMAGGHTDEPTATDEQGASFGEVDVITDGADHELVGAWNYLHGHRMGYARFFRNAPARLEAWSVEPEVADIVRTLTRSGPRARLDRLDSAMRGGSFDLGALTPALREDILILESEVRRIEAGLRDWTLARHAAALTAFAEKHGLRNLLGEIARKAPPPRFNLELLDAIQQTIDNREALRTTGEALARHRGNMAELLALGQPSLEALPEIEQRLFAEDLVFEGLRRRLAGVEPLLVELRVLASVSERIDWSEAIADARLANLPADPLEAIRRLSEIHRDYRFLAASELPSFDAGGILSEAELAEQLEALGSLDPEWDSAPHRQRWAEARDGLAAAAAISPLERNRAAIEAAHSTAADALHALRADLERAFAVRADLPTMRQAYLDDPPGPAILKPLWIERIETVFGSHGEAAPPVERIVEIRQAAERWRATFAAVGEDLAAFDWPAPSPEADSAERQAFLEGVLTERVAASAAHFLRGLPSPFRENASIAPELIRWRADELQPLRDRYAAIASELDALEATLRGRGDRFFPDLPARLDELVPASGRPSSISRLVEGAEALDGVAAATPTDLFKLAAEEEWPGLVWAAWDRLRNHSDWPRARDDLEAARDLADRLRSAEPAAEPALDADLRALWRRALSRAGQPGLRAQRQPLWQFADDQRWSLDEFNLPFEWIFDYRVIDHANQPLVEHSAAEAEAVRDRFVREIRMIAGDPADPAITAFLDELEGLEIEDGGGLDESVLASAGPGAVGWDLAGISPDEAEPWVRYTWRSNELRRHFGGDGAYHLTFRLIEQDDGERFFIATDETPVGLFFDWILERGLWSEYRDAFPSEAFSHEAGRAGPSAWFLAEDGTLEFRSSWISGRRERDGIGRFAPLNYINARTASRWAAHLGARLPTPAEFLAAIADPAAETGEETANLRDAAWKREQKKLISATAPRLEGDIFAPSGLDVFPDRRGARHATDHDDGTLWFREVGRAPDGNATPALRNLRGNVAEFLHDPHEDRFYIAGASALSPSEIDWRTPYAATYRGGIEPGSPGYSDVGLRLAFDAPRPPPGRVLRQALLRAPEPSLPPLH